MNTADEIGWNAYKTDMQRCFRDVSRDIIYSHNKQFGAAQHRDLKRLQLTLGSHKAAGIILSCGLKVK